MLLIDICSMENQKGNMKACPPSLAPFHSGSDVPKSPLSGRRNGGHKNLSSRRALGLRSQCAFQSLMSLFWDASCPLQRQYQILSGAEERGLCYGVKRRKESRSGTSQNPQTPTPNLTPTKNNKSHVL